MIHYGRTESSRAGTDAQELQVGTFTNAAFANQAVRYPPARATRNAFRKGLNKKFLHRTQQARANSTELESSTRFSFADPDAAVPGCAAYMPRVWTLGSPGAIRKLLGTHRGRISANDDLADIG